MDYVGFAKSLGALGFNIESIDEIDEVLKNTFNNDKVVIVNCLVDQNTNVYPMVPPGKSIYEAISE